ncbi:MAG TPA: hypothetical protein VFA22_03990 [Stellaceae bacterium]|nr:hypothetical protein [Stellaceae bacterium]
MADEGDAAGWLGGEACREAAAQLIDAAPPIKRMKDRIVAGRSQMQLQPQIRIQHHAAGLYRPGARQPELAQTAGADVDGIDPQHIARERRAARQPEQGAHDARHDDGAAGIGAQLRSLRRTRESDEVAVLGGAEEHLELLPLETARQKPLGLLVAPREAVVRRDMVRVRMRTGVGGLE